MNPYNTYKKNNIKFTDMIVMLSNPVKLEPTAPLHWRTCKVNIFIYF